MTALTLSNRLSEGRIPVAEALRYSLLLAETLRKLHESGRAHGAVSPSTIHLTNSGLELAPAPPVDTETAYMAPEVLAGNPPDARSDIYSFGAVVFELLSGRAAFEGSERGPVPASGSPAVDRLVAGCMAADAEARVPRIQKIMLELKLLAVSASRTANPSAARWEPEGDALWRVEMQQMEARLMAHLQASDRALGETQRLASEVLNQTAESESGLRTEMMQLEARVAGRIKGNERLVSEMQLAIAEDLHRDTVTAADPRLRVDLEQMEGRITRRLADMERRLSDAMARIEKLEEREPVSVDGIGAASVEAAIQGVRNQVHELHDLVAEDFTSFEKALQAQATAIDSSRTAMAQTDDLVERVVEALESLQSTVLEHAEDRAVIAN